MKTTIGAGLAGLTVIVALALPGRVAAQRHTDAPYPYTVIDVGTLGGPQSSVSGQQPVLNNRGMLGGGADTSILHPDYPNINPGPAVSDRYIEHGFIWRQGVLTDLGALPGANNSYVFALNTRGDAGGVSENGASDPLTGYPEADAVLWTGGGIVNLGTLGGNESTADAVNDRGQVAGFATNVTPDAFALTPVGNEGTQTRAFLWQHGTMRDLGTLGGPDSAAMYMNNRGQVTGVSFTNAVSTTATGQPTQDPFLWEDGRMRDLGTLGGGLGYPNALNNRGEVVGAMDLAGDATHHAFLWDDEGGLTDLGALGGDNSEALWLNQAGDVVGRADVPGSHAHHGFLWKNGVLTDLGTLAAGPCTTAYGVNARDQVVGDGGTCGVGGTGWLWENGAIHDLNTLVAPSPSGLHLAGAKLINDRGEITCEGVLPDGSQHAVLLIPNRPR